MFIFLDIDGVLNSHAEHVHRRYVMREPPLDRHAPKNLATMLSRIDVWNSHNMAFALSKIERPKIVIVSKWRSIFKDHHFRELFGALLFPPDCFYARMEYYPDSSLSNRCAEISAFINSRVHDKHMVLDNIAIVDDHPIIPERHELFGRFLQIDARNGFTYTDALALVRLQKPTWPPPLILM